jgi:hypothetical protein
MTRTTNARIAGFAFLFYIAVGITQIVLGSAIRASGTAARLALMAQHTFAGLVSGPVTKIMWLPMAAFEILLGLWLLTKGVAPPVRRQSS